MCCLVRDTVHFLNPISTFPVYICLHSVAECFFFTPSVNRIEIGEICAGAQKSQHSH